jgi:hypothetical protein
VSYGVHQLWPPPHGPAATSAVGKARAVGLLGLSGVVDLGVLVVLARAMRITEVTAVVGVLSSRLRR